GAGIDQLVFEVVATTRAIGVHDLAVRVRSLRILVQVLHVRVRGRAVEIEVVLLDVFAVIALAVGQAEQALLEDRIDAVPQRQGEAEELVVVGDAAEAVLAPAVRARAGLVVGEVGPGVAALAVVLPHRAPLALGEIRSPLAPRDALLARLLEAPRLFGRGWIFLRIAAPGAAPQLGLDLARNRRHAGLNGFVGTA